VRREQSVNDILYDALREWSDAIGCDIAAAKLDLADGSTFVVQPACLRRSLPVVISTPVAANSWPPDKGWSHQGQQFSFDSEVFKLGGRAGDILRLLIDRGEPCDLDTLRREVWLDYACDDSVIRMAISRLRRNLKEILALPDDFDPIETSENTYRIKRI
jgi:hypothetical protein